MKKIALLMMVGLLATTVSAATMVITPVASGDAYGSGYFPLQGAFDDQPTWNSTASEPENAVYAGSDGPQAYAENRYGYIDFGADYDQITINEGWTRYRTWSGGTQYGYKSAFWTDTNPDVWPGVLGANKPVDAIDDTTVDFNNNVVPHQGSRIWMQSFVYAGGYTLERRYLVLESWGTPSEIPTSNNRAEEYAFIGEMVPEPATMGLLALGGVALLRKRRK